MRLCDLAYSFRKDGGSTWPGSPAAEQWAAMLDFARAADAGPFESIWVYDHFHTVPVPTEEATHEAWTLMAALGAAT